jgi:SAM-dependent methyltransferase
MDASQTLKNKLLFEKASAEGVVRDRHNPIWDYADTLLDGPIIDIGCGQSDILLGFAATNRTLIAFDTEPLQLEWLKQLAQLQVGVKLENWHFLVGSFPSTPLPAHQYALISFSNLLHFLPWEECITAIADLASYVVPGTQLYVRVHSDRHVQNQVDDPAERYDYFKHYFTTKDIEFLFPAGEFQYLYLAEVTSAYTKEDKDFDTLWVREWCHQQGVYNTVRIEQITQEQLSDGSHNYLTALVRKR